MKYLVTALLLILGLGFLNAQWHIDEGFEGITTLPAGWTYFDDGDGNTWRNLAHAFAHTGARAAFCENFFPNQNADWLVTPQISVSPGDSLFFFTRAWYGTESLQVRVSISGATPAQLTIPLANIQNLNTTYREVALSLNQFAGQNINIGFFWQCQTYGILIDDVKIGKDLSIDPELNLPDEVSFFLSDELNLDFGPYVVCTNPAYASLSVEPNPHLNVSIDGLNVSISSTGFLGSTELLFTLHDQINGQTAQGSLIVNVLPDPNVDLYIQSVISPRTNEYLAMPFTPAVLLGNGGQATYENQVEIEITVYSPAGTVIHSETAIQTALLGPDQSQRIDFSIPISILEEGVYEFHFQIMSADDNPDNNLHIHQSNLILRVTAGGPDSFGYRFIDSNDPLGPAYDWIDISQTGISTIMYGVPSFSGDDNFSEPIPLGFNFPYYGSSYNSAYVDTNGEILLAPNTWYRPYPNQGWDSDGNMFNYVYPIPGYAQMPALIAVYWDDLHADQGTGDVYFQSFGQAPNRYAVIQWNNLRFHAGTGGTPQLKFQVILHEGGSIKMQYHTVATGQTGATVPRDFGQSATVAIQNEAANAGLVYLREIIQGSNYLGVDPPGNLLHDELAILFYAGADDQAPLITHKAIGNTFATDIDLTARILDMSALDDVRLFHNTGSGWVSSVPVAVNQNDYYFGITNLSLGTQVQYYFEATDAYGNTARLPNSAPQQAYSFKVLPTAGAEVLIAYSGSQDYQRVELPVYENLLTELNIPYDIYDWEEYPQYSFPEQYRGIIAYASTGTVSDKMYHFATALTNYLDLGTQTAPKNLWFASDGLASSQHAHPNSSTIRRMMSGYFRTSYVATGFGGGTNGLGGPNNYNYEHGTIRARPGTMIGNVNQDYPVYANSPDCIFPNNAAGDPYFDDVPYPEIGAIHTYTFRDGPIGGQAYLFNGVAATQVNTPSFRTWYFSFDFSQLTNPTHRREWMQDLMNWWNVQPVSNNDQMLPQPVTAIQGNYPNPFNPSTTIRYSLGSPGEVELGIYNIRGQRVKSLVSGHLEAGNYSTFWDGLDTNGASVASGIYFVRLQSTAGTHSKKITLIK